MSRADEEERETRSKIPEAKQVEEQPHLRAGAKRASVGGDRGGGRGQGPSTAAGNGRQGWPGKDT